MGAFKNQLIAEQVEEADRIPAPIRAERHVSLQYRNRKIVGPVVMSKKRYLTIVISVTAMSLFIGVVLGGLF